MAKAKQKKLGKFEQVEKAQGRGVAKEALQEAIDKKGKVVKTAIYGLI